LGFPHWGWSACALGLYVISLVAWSARYGIPVQRELVIAWTCGALACASIGRPPRQMLQVLRDWLPIVLVLCAYDFTRGAADSLGISVHSQAMIDFDRFLFFGQTPTEWLQAHLYEPGVVNWWDVVFTLVYTSYFIVPFALAGVLWVRDRLAFLRFARRLVSLPGGPATYIAGGAALMAAQRACSMASSAPPVTGGRCSAGAPPGSSRRARRASTSSPSCPPCTPPSRPSSRCSCGVASVRPCAPS
jgi:hypothetical protein